MSKSSFKQNHQGLWEKDGVVYSHIAEIRTDKCLLAALVRKDLFRSHALVIYFPETIVREEKKMDDDTFFISIILVEQAGAKMVMVPLCMLGLCVVQQEELIKLRHVPRKAFIKHAIAMHAEAIEPTNIEEEALEIENEILSNREIFSN